MKNEKLVSIIIPCYNYGHLIKETLISIQKQTYSNIEVIIINDGSTDETSKVCSMFCEQDLRFQVYNFKNAGLAESRNRGIRLSKGDYIQFIDADDLIEDNKIKIQVGLSSAFPSADIIYGEFRYFENNPFDLNERKYSYWGKKKKWIPMIQGYGAESLATALKYNNITHLSSAIFKKSAIKKVGFFDTSVNAVADFQYLIRCLIGNLFFYYKDIEGSYSLVRWHQRNMSNNIFLMNEEAIRMRISIREQLQKLPEVYDVNEFSIKSLKYNQSKNWKSLFISGSFLDFIKPYLYFLGLEKGLKRIFYSKH